MGLEGSEDCLRPPRKHALQRAGRRETEGRAAARARIQAEFRRTRKAQPGGGPRVLLALGFLAAWSFFGSPMVRAGEGGVEVAVVKDASLPAYDQVVAAFSVESGARVVEYDLQQDAERARRLFEAIRKRAPGFVLAVGPTAAAMAQRTLGDTPVLHCMVPRAERLKLKAGNLTGIALEPSAQAQLGLLKALAPRLRRVGVLHGPDGAGWLEDAGKAAAAKLGLELLTRPVDSPDDLDEALPELVGEADGLWLLPDRAVLKRDCLKKILAAAGQRRLPVLAFAPNLVAEGALAALSPDYAAVGRQAARLARPWLQGGKGGLGPVAEPESLEVTLGLGTARKLGFAAENARDLLTYLSSGDLRLRVVP